MTSVSIGDLAQSLILRRAAAAARQDLASLTAELAAGQATDAGRHLGANVSTLLALESAVGQAKLYGQTARQAASRAAAMQTVLSGIGQTAGDVAQSLLFAASSKDPSGLSAAGARAMSGLEQVVGALNARFGGAALFSGTGGDTLPLAPAAQILQAAQAAIGPVVTLDDAVARLKDWMASPSGFAAAAYRGTSEAVEIPVGPEETVRLDFFASDSQLQGTIAGLVMGSLLADGQFANSIGGPTALAQMAGQTLLSEAGMRTDQTARLGVIEARLESAVARHTAEEAALGLARNDLLSVDLFSTSSRLAETETRLQAIHALTARLARLSLTDHL